MRYILIVGGELFNKGAQAMTFALVEELKNKYPNKKIVLLSADDYKRDIKEKEKYDFKILPWNRKMVLSLAFPVGNIAMDFLPGAKYKKELKEMKAILKNTDAIYDINGYALSSQFGSQMSYLYLWNIKIAKKYNIKMFLLPQSFGPFDYKGINKIILDKMIKKYIKYPVKVFARENDGYNNLKSLTKANLVKSYDLVLHTKEPKEKNIYKQISKERKKIKIREKSIAIVPNMQIIRHGNKEKIYETYFNIINKELAKGKNVYLISHSNEDLKICNDIKNKYFDNDSVIMIKKELSCIEFSNIVDQFEFIIASRYHSIIHAYKKGVPSFVLGWAVKYQELLEVFKQDNYLYDVRNTIDEKDIMNKLDIFEEEKDCNKKLITDTYNIIRKKDILKINNVFEI